MDATKPGRDMKPEFILAVVTAVATASAYLCGFVYLSTYYEFFGISWNEIEYSIQEIFSASFPTYAGWAIAYWDIIFILVAMFISVALMLKNEIVLIAWWIWIPIISIAVVSGSYYIARDVGRFQAASSLNNLPPLRTATPGNEADHGGVDLRFLAATDTVIYAIWRPNGDSYFWTYRIPTSRLTPSRVFSE